MFNLTLLDHLRLTFSQVAQSHNAHAKAAQSNARRGRRLRGTETLLVAAASLTATGAAFGYGRPLAIAAAAFAGAALIVLIVHLTFDYDALARSHAACTVHLWEVRERYRALLSDLRDGVLDLGEARLRRDRLTSELKVIYEKTPLTRLDDMRSAEEDVEIFAPEARTGEGGGATVPAA